MLHAVSYGYTLLHRTARGYTGQIKGYTWLHRAIKATHGYTGLRMSTEGYKRLHRDIKGYTLLHRDIKGYTWLHRTREPVWPSGKAVGW